MFLTAAHASELVTESSVWLATGLSMSWGNILNSWIVLYFQSCWISLELAFLELPLKNKKKKHGEKQLIWPWLFWWTQSYFAFFTLFDTLCQTWHDMTLCPLCVVLCVRCVFSYIQLQLHRHKPRSGAACQETVQDLQPTHQLNLRGVSQVNDNTHWHRNRLVLRDMALPLLYCLP